MPAGKRSSKDLHKAVPPSFGEDVKRVRLARRLTQKHLGKVAGYSEGHVSKVEAGLVAPSPRFAEGCDRAFGTGDLFARQLKRITEGEHPAWFAPYIDAEWEASSIRDFSAIHIMGLLQTERYARAVLQDRWDPPSDEELEAQVTSRLRRREILERAEPPRVWIVLHEASLWTEVGSPHVMAEQLSFVLGQLRAHRHLVVQVLPNSATPYAFSSPYTLLEIPDARPVVYVEGPQGGRPYDAEATISNAVGNFDQLRACSLSPHDSTAIISTVRSEHARYAVDQVQLQRQPRRSVRRVGPGSRARRSRPGPGQ